MGETAERKNKRYPLHECTLYKCQSKKKLAVKLQLSLEELMSLCSGIGDSYIKYHQPKSDGSMRTITEPKPRLKSVQRRILDLFRRVERPDWLMSGEKGKSYITNAQAHLGSDYLLKADIEKFYDNSRREYVYRFFRDAVCTSPDVAKVLTDIVTYEGCIPTGSPTSQMMAYYAYREMFESVESIALKHGCIFSLYVDDLTFSSCVPFDPGKLIREVRAEVRKFGHDLKREKVKYYSRGVSKLVTGTIIDGRRILKVPNGLQCKIRSQTMEFKKMVRRADKRESGDFSREMVTLRGRVQSARNIERSIFPEVKHLVEEAAASD